MKNGSNLPITTVTQSRVALFQPTQIPTRRGGEWVKTSWGKCRVTGRLGQRHADLFESIFYCSEKSRLNETIGCWELLVDPARIRAVLSDKGYSGTGLEKLFTELAEATVEIEADGWTGCGHLVDTHKKSTFTKPNPLTGELRSLVYVRIGDAGMMLLKSDIGRWRDPTPIARLRSGVSQAVARLVLSHRDGGRMRIDTALTAVGIPAKPGHRRRDAREALRGDAEGLARCGVLFLDGFVSAERRVVQPPDGVVQTPDGVVQPPDGVVQPPDCLESLGLSESLENQNQQNQS